MLRPRLMEVGETFTRGRPWVWIEKLNYRVDQKVTKFGIFSDPIHKLSALTPERGRSPWHVPGQSNWLRLASIRLAWHHHMLASSMPSTRHFAFLLQRWCISGTFFHNMAFMRHPPCCIFNKVDKNFYNTQRTTCTCYLLRHLSCLESQIQRRSGT